VSPPGLTAAEAAVRLEADGLNALPEAASTPLWLRVLRQFRSPLIYILLFALAFDVGVWVHEGGAGLPVEALAIAAILALNAGLGVYQERRSEQALAELNALAAPHCWVKRDGTFVHLLSEELVRGDVVRIEAGERIPADGRLLESAGVLIDEAILSGESLPVEKATEAEVFSGTLAVRGNGLMEVTATGTASTMGKLATMLQGIEVEQTPLEQRLEKLGHQIAAWVGALALLLVVAGVTVEGPSRFAEVVIFSVALAVAAVPEGLPAVVTLTLALGVQRMARKKAVVRRLSAVEALGSVTVIATDKTGTLTENRMQVHSLESSDEEEALYAVALANEADEGSDAGDPLDLGLLAYAHEQGVDVESLRASWPRTSFRAFDSEWKFTRVTVRADQGVRSYLKGAPEVILSRCELSTDERSSWRDRANEAATDGYRVLGLAVGAGDAEEGLTFLGLVTIWDPPRPEVPGAIRSAQDAGVRVVMITGDHPGTAKAVAAKIGIPDCAVITGEELERLAPDDLQRAVRESSVFARVSPEHKLRLVESLQAQGEVVAMTGDGVNDAPALKRSDVGVAMGQRGSEVSREVADLVLLDDNFATIVGAIEEGRSIYENIQTFIRFTLSTNVALVLLVVLGAVGAYLEGLRDVKGNLLLPLTALQLLWINFLGDGPPALALAFDRNPDVMTKPPRPRMSALLDAASARFVMATGLVKGLVGLVLLVVAPLVGVSLLATQTLVFMYESIAKLVSAYPARRVRNHPQLNKLLHLAILGGILLQILALTVPQLRSLLGIVPLAPLTLLATGSAIAFTWCASEGVAHWFSRTKP